MLEIMGMAVMVLLQAMVASGQKKKRNVPIFSYTTLFSPFPHPHHPMHVILPFDSPPFSYLSRTPSSVISSSHIFLPASPLPLSHYNPHLHLLILKSLTLFPSSLKSNLSLSLGHTSPTLRPSTCASTS